VIVAGICCKPVPVLHPGGRFFRHIDYHFDGGFEFLKSQKKDGSATTSFAALQKFTPRCVSGGRTIYIAMYVGILDSCNVLIPWEKISLARILPLFLPAGENRFTSFF